VFNTTGCYVLRPWEGRKVLRCVCLSVCPLAWLENCTAKLQFSCTLPVAVARSFSGRIAICYQLPVLWMTSHVHIMVLGCVMCIP